MATTSWRRVAQGALGITALSLADAPHWAMARPRLSVAGVSTNGAPSRAEAPHGRLGLMADVGVPDGAIVSVAVRPARWLRLHGGAGTNTVSAGFRGGVTFNLPATLTPSLSAELGHYPAGPASPLVRGLLGIDERASGLFHRIGYTYVNAHGGLEWTERRFIVFLYGGVTLARGTIEGAPGGFETDGAAGARVGRTSVTLNDEAALRIASPSAKLGFVLLL